MGYTKTLQSKSQNVLITGAPQSLADLIGEAPEEDANVIILFFQGSLTGVNPISWVTEDGNVTVAVNTGRPVYTGGNITITKVNFETFGIIKHSGGDFNMWLVQYDSESLTL